MNIIYDSCRVSITYSTVCIHDAICHFILSFYSHIIRCMPVTDPPPLISMTTHALRGRRYNAEFQRWFVLKYKHGKGRQNLMKIALKADEFLVDLFATACLVHCWTENQSPKWIMKMSGNLHVMTITTISFEKWTISFLRCKLMISVPIIDEQTCF